MNKGKSVKLAKQYYCKLCEKMHGKKVEAEYIHLGDSENLSVCEACWNLPNLLALHKQYGLFR